MTESAYTNQLPLFNSPFGLALIELGALVLFIGVTTWLVYRGLVRLVERLTNKERKS